MKPTRPLHSPPARSGRLLAGVLAACTLVFGHWPGDLRAEPSPTVIPFQGRLTNPQGVPYNSGQYTISFRLYDQAVGGTVLWTEPHAKVGVINGMVNVFLGSINPLTGVDFSQTRHLGITIDADNNPNTADPEMVPRQMIIPAFYAKNSEKLAGYDWSALLGTNNPATGQIQGGKIADRAIQDRHIGILSHLDASDGSPANAVFVDDAGRVGIGTTAPLTKLHIDGGTGDAFLRLENSNPTRSAAILLNDSSAGTVQHFIGHEGPQPNGLLSGSRPQALIIAAGGTNSVQFGVNDQPVMTILTGARVGIGTTSPQASLDVDGRILRKGQALSLSGNADNGALVNVPWGTTDDWSIFVSARTMGHEEEPLPSELDNALLRIECFATPNGQSGWTIVARYKFKWSNANTSWYYGSANYLLVPK